MEVTANMVQEGYQAIADTVMEKKMKARGPGAHKGQGELSGPWLVHVM